MRLCNLLAVNFDRIDAHYYNVVNARGQRGILRQPPWRIVSLTYAWAIELIDPEKLEDWEMELIDLLPWQDSASEAAIQMESDSFMNMMNKKR